MKIILVLIWFCLQFSTAVARLGDNEKQIEQRYGIARAVKIDNELGVRVGLYKKNDLIISVIFKEGRSVVEKFEKNGFEKITDAEAEQILEANAGDHRWRSDDAWTETRVRSDSKAIARFQPFYHWEFYIYDVEFLDFAKNKFVELDKAKLVDI